jgi:hypothetical protein
MTDPTKPGESNAADADRPVSRRTEANKAGGLRWAIGLMRGPDTGAGAQQSIARGTTWPKGECAGV